MHLQIKVCNERCDRKNQGNVAIFLYDKLLLLTGRNVHNSIVFIDLFSPMAICRFQRPGSSSSERRSAELGSSMNVQWRSAGGGWRSRGRERSSAELQWRRRGGSSSRRSGSAELKELNQHQCFLSICCSFASFIQKEFTLNAKSDISEQMILDVSLSISDL